ncbi:MAG: tRNA pseudouridine55 synthase [Clostridia bacterium]|nr:tRNA pseudouridine55 synthase [Clostridia bacterium]
MEFEGFINFLKPPGPTSHDVVDIIRRYLGVRRVGHGGTLDPAAAGVLPLAVGNSTRLLQYVQEGGKSYRAEIVFGRETDTQDSWGKIIAERPVEMLGRDKLEQVLAGFRGPVYQMPPMVSAIRVGGQRLYNLARQGKEVQRQPRLIFISRLELVALWPWGPFPRALLDITCSKGTYIRTLAADLGRALGSGAYLDFLVRTKAGPFSIGNSYTLEEISDCLSRKDYSFLLPPETGLKHLPAVWLKPWAERLVLNGAPVKPEGLEGAPDIKPGALVAVFSKSGQLLAVGRWLEGDARILKAVKVVGKRS